MCTFTDQAINLMKETGLRALIVERRNEEDANTGIRRAPVIQGEILGIVSVSDIIRKAVF
jgi:CBS domain-containing protein